MNNTAFFQFLAPITHFITRKMAVFLSFLHKHYTPLAILVLAVSATIFFFVTGYLFRYSHWNYWLWKNRAAAKSIYFGILLIVIKILIGVL